MVVDGLASAFEKSATVVLKIKIARGAHAGFLLVYVMLYTRIQKFNSSA